MVRILFLFFFTFSLYSENLDLKKMCSFEEDFETYHKYKSDGRNIKAEEILKNFNKKLDLLIKHNLVIKSDTDYNLFISKSFYGIYVVIECPTQLLYRINLALRNSLLDKETQKEIEDIKENGKFEIEAVIKASVEIKDKTKNLFVVDTIDNTIIIPVKINKLIIPPESRKE